ncbi:Os05g0345800 [Oryza sativa Japonica Group]|uniref:Os05g0345800 protein n=2 Tax=Oryza sativa subsp. japonica TaxID=39947 RepID=B9FP03_ORYSJ|nr:hypothetical protein OsJ_18150 [Oryza sativa Japonica Group]BAS93495.1 Os05g0345800 [Oryza sativa Japonica Group]
MTFGGRSNNIVQLGREAVVEVRSLGGVAARWLCRHTGGAKLVLIEGEGEGVRTGGVELREEDDQAVLSRGGGGSKTQIW